MSETLIVSTKAQRDNAKGRALRIAQRGAIRTLAKSIHRDGEAYEKSIHDALESYDPDVRQWGVQEMGRNIRAAGIPRESVAVQVVNLIGADVETAKDALALRERARSTDRRELLAMCQKELESAGAIVAWPAGQVSALSTHSPEADQTTSQLAPGAQGAGVEPVPPQTNGNGPSGDFLSDASV